LHSEGVHAIQRTLQCSADHAKAILQDLRMRQLIDITITQGRQFTEPILQKSATLVN